MAQAKRSPILGYNHNVKYRGVIFHVQTEDSGLLNPHLFTHLFHEGVIVSTRKLVYDAGSNEDAIKALMQAQHKAVMKDLKKGLFDEKIDQYLSDVTGLEPRASAGAAAGEGGAPAGEKKERAKTEVSPPPEEAVAAPALEIVEDNLSEPIELPMKGRAPTGDRTIPVQMPVYAQTPPPPSADLDPPTDLNPVELPLKPRTSTAQRVSRPGIGPGAGARVVGVGQPPGPRDSSPVLDITEDEIGARLRSPRDTSMDGIPRAGSDSVGATNPVRSGNPAAHNAAALGAAKPPSRPNVPTPGGDDRAGTYSVSRKSGDAPIREKTGRIAAIKPGEVQASRTMSPRESSGVPQSVPREPTPKSGRVPSSPPPTPVARTATPQHQMPRATAPIQNRSTTPANPGGVVTTRPAVVVGATPARPAQPSTGRVRKAREDEGRGFGQGLISEKSLDEVILAYLSEDADEK